MKPAYWLIIVAIVLALGLGAILVTTERGGAPKGKDLGPAPEFTVKIIDGKTVSLKDYRGKPLVVNFWASWCPPCREEAPVLGKVARAYKGQATFLGIVFQDTVANVKKFEREFSVPYDSALDPGGKAARAYKITGIPETYVIDAKGRLRGKWIGAIDEETLTKLVEGAL